MFEHSLVVRQKSRRRGLVLAMAVGMHGAGLATVVLASAWSVGEVPPPEQHVVFNVPLDVTHLLFEQPERRAVPPPAPPPAAPTAPHNDPAPVQPAPQPQVTQPTTVPEQTPVASTSTDDVPIAEGDAPPSSDPTNGSGPVAGNGPPGPAWGDGDGEVALALDARMTRPETIFRVTPRYTEAARIARREGTVIVQATIDRTGHVTDLRLIKSLGLGLDESAMNAVQQWRFKPAVLAGRPVPVYFQLSVNFTVR
ncbi:MAG TPA: energy transducer TonB [Thermoanaerobaculia bacterium]|jgi:TonB family protein|nr:energy transducer TonB [Thermoanaerobaculia bacterium]